MTPLGNGLFLYRSISGGDHVLPAAKYPTAVLNAPAIGSSTAAYTPPVAPPVSYAVRDTVFIYLSEGYSVFDTVVKDHLITNPIANLRQITQSTGSSVTYRVELEFVPTADEQSFADMVNATRFGSPVTWYPDYDNYPTESFVCSVIGSNISQRTGVTTKISMVLNIGVSPVAAIDANRYGQSGFRSALIRRSDLTEVSAIVNPVGANYSGLHIGMYFKILDTAFEGKAALFSWSNTSGTHNNIGITKDGLVTLWMSDSEITPTTPFYTVTIQFNNFHPGQWNHIFFTMDSFAYNPAQLNILLNGVDIDTAHNWVYADGLSGIVDAPIYDIRIGHEFSTTLAGVEKILRQDMLVDDLAMHTQTNSSFWLSYIYASPNATTPSSPNQINYGFVTHHWAFDGTSADSQGQGGNMSGLVMYSGDSAR